MHSQLVTPVSSRRVFPFALLFCLFCGFAFAAGSKPVFPRGMIFGLSPDDGKRIPIPLESTEVVLDVKPGLMEVQVTQTFVNRTETALEATYLYPLPDRATLTHFELHYQDHTVYSVVREKAAARAVYEAAKVEGKKTALLEQQDPSLFSTAVANFLPGERVQVVIRFVQPLELTANGIEVRFPMVTGDKYFPADAMPGSEGNAAPNPARRPNNAVAEIHVYAFDVQIAGIPVKSIKSSSHDIRAAQIGTAPERFAVTLEKEITIPDRDFVLRIETRPGAGLQPTVVTQRTTTGDYGLVTVFPPTIRPKTVTAPPPRDVLFLIDRSGSMAGPRLESAKLGLEGCLDALAPEDRFQIVTFDDRFEFYRSSWIENGAKTLADARRHVRGIKVRGGTEVQAALSASLDVFEPNARQQILILITDGDVGNAASLLNLVERKIGQVRLFMLGIGEAPNATLIKQVAELGRGQARFITRDADVARELGDLFATLDAPVLTEPKLELFDVEGNQLQYTMFPERLPDVFFRRPAQIVYRTRGVPAIVLLTGVENDHTVTHRLALEPSVLRGDGLEKEYGRRLFADTGRMLRRAETEEQRVLVRKEMLETALQFQLVTELTSRVAVDDRVSRDPNSPLASEHVAQFRPADQFGANGTVLMTPFQVTTDTDVGYTAGNTLSGGRVDTPLAITPGSISVMTKEFMDDFNVTNMNDAGNWTIGFDLGTPVPNSDPSSVSVYQNIVRGAPSTDNFPTRNGSINFGVADSYNTERFEFQRGPDTSMFGDGGPGGRQGSSSKQVSFHRTATSFSTQVDSWNGYRETLDYNKGWERVGLRFNALYQNNRHYQEKDRIKKAWTVNAAVKVTRDTKLVVEYERVNEWNSLWSITNGDVQMLWDSVTINPDNSALLANSNTALNNAGLERMAVGANGGATNYFVYNFATGDMQDYGGNQYRTRGIPPQNNTRIPFNGNPYLMAIPSRRPMISGIDRKFSLAPKDNVAARDTDTGSINLEHRVGNLFVRIGYVRNNFDNNTVWSNLSANGYIVDVNQLLPNGKLNPKFLKGFTDVEQNNLYSQDAVREFSALATYRVFVPQWWDYKQQLSLNLSDRATQSESRTSAWRRTDNPASADPFNNTNRFFYRVYWDEPRPEIGPILTNPNGVVPGQWSYVDTAGNITERTVKHGGLSSQTSFFNEKLTITGSYSRDSVGIDNLPRFGSSGAPDFKNVLGFQTAGNHYRKDKNVSSSAIGLVAYPFQFRKYGPFKGFISPLGFVFNFAENNQPPPTGTQNPLIDGTEPPLTHSRTKDLGLRYSVPGGKVYLTLTYYKTDQIDNPAGFGSAGDITNIWINLGYTDPKLTTTTSSGFAYSDPSSRRLEGWEAELTANPTRNITLSANYSHPISFIVRESEDRKAYVAAHRAEWEAGARASQGTVLNGHTVIAPDIIQSSLNSIDNNLAGLTTGTLENNQVRHRINLTGAYSFREGRLKGLRVNAGVQYRGHNKSGSRDARIKFRLPDNVAPTTQQNTEAAFDYLWTAPTWKNTLTAGANYTRRFGRYQTRFQLNVTNLLNDLDPIWGRSGPSGNGGSAYTLLTTNQLFAGNPRVQVLNSFVPAEPRKFTFTTTISF
jgi:Ca-activated chloride channel homolog